MLLTDEEARKQICPFIRYCVNPGDVIAFGYHPIYDNQLCQGLDCKMAWRIRHTNSVYGYCGIVGKPNIENVPEG